MVESMQLHTFQPPANLARYIRCYWALEGKPDAAKPFVHRALAGTCSEMIFYYKGRFKMGNGTQKSITFNSGIYGQTQQYQKFDTGSEFGMFGVQLYPYALPCLLGIPACEISDQAPDLKTLFGKAGEALEEEMILAHDNGQRTIIISSFFAVRLKHIKSEYSSIIDSVRQIVHSGYSFSINDFAGKCFLSRRQFERKFKEFTGFSPKLFSRIARFDAATKESVSSRSLTQLAIDLGYYDQAHFIHDFSRFSGYTPKEFFTNIPADVDYRAAAEFKL